jgi:hypothetical protein
MSRDALARSMRHLPPPRRRLSAGTFPLSAATGETKIELSFAMRHLNRATT